MGREPLPGKYTLMPAQLRLTFTGVNVANLLYFQRVSPEHFN